MNLIGLAAIRVVDVCDPDLLGRRDIKQRFVSAGHEYVVVTKRFGDLPAEHMCDHSSDTTAL
jgi:hypothetical protein